MILLILKGFRLTEYTELLKIANNLFTQKRLYDRIKKSQNKKERKMADAKILATIDRTDTEQLQISISEYKGKSYLNMRIFYTTDDGATWLPTKKGVTFTPDQIDILTDAIEAAKQEFMAEEMEA